MYRFNQKEILDITNYIFLEDALAPADVIFIPGCDRPEHTEEPRSFTGKDMRRC